MRLKISIFLFLLIYTFIHAQSHGQKVEFAVDPIFKGNIYQPGDSIIVNKNTIKVEKIRFYLSSFQLGLKNKIVWREHSSYHLLNLLEPKKNSISLSIPKNLQYDEIVFNLGIDSATNSSGVYGGDLDPTNGMYWTWQSGYINLKVEGYCANCNTRNHIFEFHLGGYKYPFASVQEVRLPIDQGNSFFIGFDLEKFFQFIDMYNGCAMMSPSQETVILSFLAANSFYLVK